MSRVYATSGGIGGTERVHVHDFSLQWEGEAAQVIAVVVVPREYFRNRTESGAMIRKAPEGSGPWASSSASGNCWSGLDPLRRVLGVNDQEFPVPEHKGSYVVLANPLVREGAILLSVPEIPRPPRGDRFLQLRVILGSILYALGGSPFRSKREMWVDQICEISEVKNFLEQARAAAYSDV